MNSDKVVILLTPLRKDFARDKRDIITDVDDVDDVDSEVSGDVGGDYNDSWDLDAVMAVNPKMADTMQGFRKSFAKLVYLSPSSLEEFDKHDFV